MRAVVLSEFGSPDHLRLVQVDTPRPEAGQVLVKVEAAGVHPADLRFVTGGMGRAALPRVLGRDFAGTVVAGPAELLNKRVFGTGGELGRSVNGALAGCVIVGTRGVVEMPEAMSAVQGACLGVSLVAAWKALFGRADLRVGQTLVVIGATGGVGSVAVQLGRWTGARVIGVVRTSRQGDMARELGAREVIVDEAGTDLAHKVAAISPTLAHVVLDATGGAATGSALACVGLGGALVTIDNGDAGTLGARLRDVSAMDRMIVGVNPQSVDAAASAEILRRVIPAIAAGALGPGPIAREYALADTTAAFQSVAQGIKGRVVVHCQR